MVHMDYGNLSPSPNFTMPNPYPRRPNKYFNVFVTHFFPNALKAPKFQMWSDLLSYIALNIPFRRSSGHRDFTSLQNFATHYSIVKYLSFFVLHYMLLLFRSTHGGNF